MHKILKCNTASTNPITLDGEDPEEVVNFTYLGSIVDKQGGSDADVKVRIGKGSILATEEHVELKTTVSQHQSESSIRTLRQFYRIELKLGELLRPSSK
ncbi:unnamed protein product [Schistosoma margrebowiei]|uniref:Uncharacterized protein n=1 Tax=Schistosoma margrebowiei TaxID=48269 RepID=A0A183N0M0_9TREM|nr:unnamed protein product [Schistosoma margrebowiei]